MSSPLILFPSPNTVAVDTRGAEILTEESPATRDSRGIYLPHHIEGVSHIAVDIGGSLAKLVYFTRSPLPPHTPSSPPRSGDSSSSVGNGALSDASPLRPHPNGALTPKILSTSPPSTPLPQIQAFTRRSHRHRRSTHLPHLPGGLLNFTRFETSQVDQCIEFIQLLISQSAALNRVSIEEMRRSVKIMATGGGAHKFYELFKSELGQEVEVIQEEEMECLITGLGFITGIPNETFWYSDELVYKVSHLSYQDSEKDSTPNSPIAGASDTLPSTSTPTGPFFSFSSTTLPSVIPSSLEPRPGVPSISSSTAPPPTKLNASSNASATPPELPRPSPDPPTYSVSFETNPQPQQQFPCLLVNIGSGVSIIKVDADGSFERVSGTSLGGGTLWGLLSLLTDAESFDEMLALSEKGDNSTVDMLVGDIYGQDYSKVGLKSSTIASSFGKVFQKGPRTSDGASGQKKGKTAWRQEDLSRSLLYAISNNIGQIAYMNAEKYNLDRIYFGGCFIRGHPTTISTLSYAIRFWSKGTKRALFLRHEGFLGAIGAWIKNVVPDKSEDGGSNAGEEELADGSKLLPDQDRDALEGSVEREAP